MPAKRSHWDEKHLAAGEASASDASQLLVELLPLLPAGPALDVACGRGRNTLLLAERGRAVTAVDWSGTALTLLERAAAGKGTKFRRGTGEISAAARGDGVLMFREDLERAALPDEAFALVLCIQYLDRKLMPQLERTLRPGGMLLFETYTTAQTAFEGGPRNPAYLLEPGELRHSFPELKVIFYGELNAGQGKASLLAQKPAKAAEGRA